MSKNVDLYVDPVDNPLIVDEETGKCGMWTMKDLGRHWQTEEGGRIYLASQDVLGQSSHDIVGSRARKMIDVIVNDFGYVPVRPDGSPSDVLDIGCGTGDMSIRMAMLGGNVDAIDPSEVQLNVQAANMRDKDLLSRIESELNEDAGLADVKVSKENLEERIRLFKGKGELFDTDKKYDAVIMKFAEQWTDCRLLWKKLAEMVKPGGQVFLMTTLPAEGGRPNLFLSGWNRYVEEQMQQGKKYKFGSPKNVNVITHLPSMRTAVEKAGFDLSGSHSYEELTKDTPEAYIAFLTGIIKDDVLRFLEDVEGVKPEIEEVIERIRGKMYEVAELNQEPPDYATYEHIGVLSFTKR